MPNGTVEKLIPAKRPETNRDRFERVAKRRVDTAINAIRTLTKMGRNRSAYEYSEQDVERIAEGIAAEIAAMKSQMTLPTKKTGSNWKW